jgi:CHAT domain-containing protein/tetratricopeptide (TPR) repeat protein
VGNIDLLELNKPVEREISQGQIHSYQIKLGSGQYLRTTVEHWGLGVRIALYDPKGQIRAEFDCRQSGLTPASLIAEDAGTYRLEVRAREKDSIPGRYEAKIEELRPATTRDRSRIAAERAFAEAERLRAEERDEPSRQAIRKYEAARGFWQAAGDQREEADTLKNTGEVYQLLGETQKAFSYYDQALSLSREAKDLQGEGEILNNIGYLHFFSGNTQQALDNCTIALKLSRAVGNRRGEAQALSTIGEAYYGFGEMPKALEFQEQALSLWRTLNDRRGQAQALASLGYAYAHLSETQKALDSYHKALSLWRAVGESRGQAVTLIALGNLQNKLGEKQEALNLYLQARQLFQPMGDRPSTAMVLGHIAYLYRGLGEEQRALEHYNQALALFQATGDRWGAAETLLGIGRVYYLLGDHQKALNHYRLALTTFHTLAMPRLEAQTLRDIGLVYDSLGDKVRALDYYKQALVILQAGPNQRDEAYTLNYIGHVHESLNEKRKALEYYHQALPLSRAAGDRFGESLTFYNMTRAERDLGKFIEARANIETALGIVESLRTKVASQDLRASYLASIRQYYDLYIDLLMSLHQQRPSDGFEAAALEASERARARSLLELLAEARADIRQGIDSELLERERALQQLIKDKSERQMRLLSGQHTEAEAAAIAKELQELTTQYDEVTAQIKSQSPHYAALTQQPLDLQEIQQQVLDDDTLLLEYALGDERSYLWAVTPNSIASFELPKRAEVEAAARRVYDLLTARNQRKLKETPQQWLARVGQAEARYWPEAAALSRMILGPVATQLGTKRLLIVSEGALQYVPFGALPRPVGSGQWAVGSSQKPVAGAQKDNRALTTNNCSLPTAHCPLIVNHEIVSLPSASTLAVLRRELAGRQLAPKSVAVLADPVFDADDDRVRLAGKPVLASARSGEAQRSGGAKRSTRAVSPKSKARPATPAIVTDLERATRDVGLRGRRGTIERLPFSRQEADAILKLAPAGTAMKAIDFQASQETVINAELGQYRIIHFATHGLLDTQHPELSGVLLSLVDERGQPKEGFLQLHEIYNLKLPAELVVLSACQTGLGKDVKGEGLVGLTRGFMYAGAARVMASLWKVDDEATAELMKQFYQGMLQEGLAPAAALRAAQVEMWKENPRKSPRDWAAFVLQGEWK